MEGTQEIQDQSSLIHVFDESDRGAWVRLRVSEEVKQATVHFHYRDKDERGLIKTAPFSMGWRVWKKKPWQRGDPQQPQGLEYARGRRVL